MIFTSPAQHLGQRCMSMSKTRFDSRAQPMRRARPWTVSTSHSPAVAASVAAGACASDPCGTTRARSFALGASTPWCRIGCSRGRGTSAASRCMNSSGLITRRVVPSRHGYRGSGDPNAAVSFECVRS